MSATKLASFFQEPTRDEIATKAFLTWEKDGRPADREMHYWLLAETTLQEQRLAQANAAAEHAAQPWPRRTTSSSPRTAKSTKSATSAPQPTTTFTRSAATKPAAVQMSGSARPVNRVTAKTAR